MKKLIMQKFNAEFYKKAVSSILFMLVLSLGILDAASLQAAVKQKVKVSDKEYENMCQVSVTLEPMIARDMVEKMDIGDQRNYDFSKVSKRRYALRWAYLNCTPDFMWEQSNDPDILSRRIFGVSTSGVRPNPSDAGMEYFQLWPGDVYKISKSKYQLTAGLSRFYETEWGNEEAEDMGTVTFTLKKKDGSYYGYILKSVKYKKTGYLDQVG